MWGMLVAAVTKSASCWAKLLSGESKMVLHCVMYVANASLSAGAQPLREGGTCGFLGGGVDIGISAVASTVR